MGQTIGQKGAQEEAVREVGKMVSTSTGMNIGPGHFSKVEGIMTFSRNNHRVVSQFKMYQLGI